MSYGWFELVDAWAVVLSDMWLNNYWSVLACIFRCHVAAVVGCECVCSYCIIFVVQSRVRCNLWGYGAFVKLFASMLYFLTCAMVFSGVFCKIWFWVWYLCCVRIYQGVTTAMSVIEGVLVCMQYSVVMFHSRYHGGLLLCIILGC